MNESAYIPNELDSGTWRIYLEIADAASRIQRVPQYNILAVNQVPAVQQAGMNDLLRSIQVNALATTQPSHGSGMHSSIAVVAVMVMLVLYML